MADIDLTTAVDKADAAAQAARDAQETAATTADDEVRVALGFKVEPVDPEDENSYAEAPLATVGETDDVAGRLEAAGYPASLATKISAEEAEALITREGTNTSSAIDERLERLVASMEQRQSNVQDPTQSASEADAVDGEEDEGAAIKALRAQVYNQGEALKVISQLMESQAVGYNRTRLAEQYPQLTEKGGMDKIVKRAAALLKTGEYEGLDAAFDDAARLVYGNGQVPPKRVGAGAGVDRVDELRRRGLPSGRATSVREKSIDEKWGRLDNDQKGDIILRLIQEGRKDEAQRLKDLG